MYVDDPILVSPANEQLRRERVIPPRWAISAIPICVS